MNKISRTTKKHKILVTPSEACELLNCLPDKLLGAIEITPTYGRVSDKKQLGGLLADKDGVVLDLERITSEILKRCPALKVISRFGEGCDGIDFAAVKEYGVKVARTEGASSVAVARHTVALIMAIVHNVIKNDSDLKKGLWVRRPNLSEQNLSIGILGPGKIGKRVADLVSGLGFNVVVYSRKTDQGGYRHAASLDELIKSSDILSLHCPLTAQTENIISADTVGKLEGKYLVNTARGGLVDEEALLGALEKGSVLGYATDVFSEEPVSGISRRLAMHPKVICSPHVAAMDKRTAINMTRRAFENALHCLKNNHDKVVSYVC